MDVSKKDKNLSPFLGIEPQLLGFTDDIWSNGRAGKNFAVKNDIIFTSRLGIIKVKIFGKYKWNKNYILNFIPQTWSDHLGDVRMNVSIKWELVLKIWRWQVRASSYNSNKLTKQIQQFYKFITWNFVSRHKTSSNKLVKMLQLVG